MSSMVIKFAIQTSGRFSAWSANFWILSSQWVRSRRDLTHSTYAESCSSFFCKRKQRTHASLRGFAVNFENREITLPAGSRHQKKNGYLSWACCKELETLLILKCNTSWFRVVRDSNSQKTPRFSSFSRAHFSRFSRFLRTPELCTTGTCDIELRTVEKPAKRAFQLF